MKAVSTVAMEVKKANIGQGGVEALMAERKAYRAIGAVVAPFGLVV